MTDGERVERVDAVALELLVRVDSLGSVGAAARSVAMTQPHASRVLSRLERRLDVLLLARSTQGSRLTTEGTVVASWAREALEALDRVAIGARSLAEQRRAQLAVAASLTVAEYLAPRWLARFRREHGEVRVSLQVRNSREVVDLVASGGAPLGFVESPRLPRSVGATTVANDELVVVVGTDHPWARRRAALPAGELAGTPLLLRERGSGTRETLETALAAAGLGPVAAELELASTAALKAAATEGAAPAVLSDIAVRADVEAGRLRRVPLEGVDLRRRLRAVWPRDARPSGPVAELVRVARAG